MASPALLSMTDPIPLDSINSEYRSIIAICVEEIENRSKSSFSIDKKCNPICLLYPECGCQIDVVPTVASEAPPSLSYSHNSDVL